MLLNGSLCKHLVTTIDDESEYLQSYQADVKKMVAEMVMNTFFDKLNNGDKEFKSFQPLLHYMLEKYKNFKNLYDKQLLVPITPSQNLWYWVLRQG